jgi:hypothetical protein
MSNVSGTYVETRHHGPAPIVLVAWRNEATKRIQPQNRNLVLDLPVPSKLVLPCDLFRYTAVTCDSNDFEEKNVGYFLREKQMNRRTESIICMTTISLAYSGRR